MLGLWAHSKVMKDFQGSLDEAPAESSQAVLGAMRSDWRKRARSWLARSTDPTALHPRKKYRVKSKAWLHAVDHQVGLASSFRGLVSFC